MFEAQNQAIYVKSSVNCALQTGSIFHIPDVLAHLENAQIEALKLVKKGNRICTFIDKDEKPVETFISQRIEGVLSDIVFFVNSKEVTEKGETKTKYFFDMSLYIDTELTKICLRTNFMAAEHNGKISDKGRASSLNFIHYFIEYIKENGLNKSICIENQAKRDGNYASVNFYIKKAVAQPFYRSEKKIEKGLNMYNDVFFNRLISYKIEIENALKAIEIESLNDNANENQ